VSETIEVSTRAKFLELFNLRYVNLVDHWSEPELPDRKLRIVARQIVLEDGTIVQLRVEGVPVSSD